MPALIIIIVLLFILFNPRILPKIGAWLGKGARKPYRQARWMWSSFTGSEDEAIQAEWEYGHECARAFASQFSKKTARADQALVESIGCQLASAAKDRRRRFDFTATEAAPANAFALPGGYIFITTSLLNVCGRNRDEIAFFLGHEIGHVILGHARDRMTADTFLNAVAARLPAAGKMIGEVVRKGYSREQELDADQEALRLAAAAGFDVHASLSAMKRLAQVSPDPSGFAEYVSSHPSFSERLRKLEELLK